MRSDELTGTCPYASIAFPIVTWEASAHPPKLYCSILLAFSEEKTLSRASCPGPVATNSRKMKQKRAALSPPLRTGQNPEEFL